MRYLLDTNVISGLRKPAARVAPNVRAWAQRQPTHDLSIRVITVMEIEVGVARLERHDSAQGEVLRRWARARPTSGLRQPLAPDQTFDVVRQAARMHVPDPRPERDVLIAATALTRHLTVVTRNTSDFEPLGVPLVTPWAQ